METPLFIASLPLVIANVVPQTGGIPTTGSVAFLFKTPSRKIHFGVTVVVQNEAQIDISGSTWKLFPMAGQTDGITRGANPAGKLQPVINGAALPDGYEGACAIKLWRAECSLLAQNSAIAGVHGQVIAQVVYEPTPDACMSEAERKYWFGLCGNPTLDGPPLTLGTGIP